MITGNVERITQLRQEILALNGVTQKAVSQTVCPVGLPFINTHFPTGCWPTGAVHEWLCNGAEQMAASGAFIAGIMSTAMALQSPVVWISLGQPIFPVSLQVYGLQPHQIIFVHPRNQKELLWVLEEALRCASLSAVVAELTTFNFMQSRRFQLAVEQTGVTGFILHTTKKIGQNACVSRWQVNPVASSSENGLPGVGLPRWEVELLKMRHGKPGKWTIEWRHDAFTTLAETNTRLASTRKTA